MSALTRKLTSTPTGDDWNDPYDFLNDGDGSFMSSIPPHSDTSLNPSLGKLLNFEVKMCKL